MRNKLPGGSIERSPQSCCDWVVLAQPARMLAVSCNSSPISPVSVAGLSPRFKPNILQRADYLWFVGVMEPLESVCAQAEQIWWLLWETRETHIRALRQSLPRWCRDTGGVASRALLHKSYHACWQFASCARTWSLIVCLTSVHHLTHPVSSSYVLWFEIYTQTHTHTHTVLKTPGICPYALRTGLKRRHLAHSAPSVFAFMFPK